MAKVSIEAPNAPRSRGAFCLDGCDGLGGVAGEHPLLFRTGETLRDPRLVGVVAAAAAVVLVCVRVCNTRA